MNDKNSYIKLIPVGLAKTGFPLEHEVTEAFRSSGWQVINNRFYVDDVDGKARELDLVVYQVSQGKDIDVVTTLLISCKKNEQLAFTFMSRNKLRSDPNVDWHPIHQWTAQEPLRTYLESTGWKKQYISKNKYLREKIFEIGRDAFATQLVSQVNGSPQNDRTIFDSISGLMKALDHEIVALPSRSKQRRLYVFNLVTVVDAPMIDARFSGAKIEPIEITDFKYLSRYIVRKRELAARIHFASKTQLRALVDTYTKLTEHDKKFFEACVADSFEAITTMSAVQTYFAKKLSPLFGWRINHFLRQASRDEISENIDIGYDPEREELFVELPTDTETVNFLEKNEVLMKSLRNLLRDHARYKGAFRIAEQIPF